MSAETDAELAEKAERLGRLVEEKVAAVPRSPVGEGEAPAEPPAAPGGPLPSCHAPPLCGSARASPCRALLLAGHSEAGCHSPRGCALRTRSLESIGAAL